MALKDVARNFSFAKPSLHFSLAMPVATANGDPRQTRNELSPNGDANGHNGNRISLHLGHLPEKQEIQPPYPRTPTKESKFHRSFTEKTNGYSI